MTIVDEYTRYQIQKTRLENLEKDNFGLAEGDGWGGPGGSRKYGGDDDEFKGSKGGEADESGDSDEEDEEDDAFSPKKKRSSSILKKLPGTPNPRGRPKKIALPPPATATSSSAHASGAPASGSGSLPGTPSSAKKQKSKPVLKPRNFDKVLMDEGYDLLFPANSINPAPASSNVNSASATSSSAASAPIMCLNGKLEIPNYLSIASWPSIKPKRSFCSICGFKSNYTCTRCGAKFCCIACQEVHKDTRCLKFTA